LEIPNQFSAPNQKYSTNTQRRTVIAELLFDLVQIRATNDADLDLLACLGQERTHLRGDAL
jgi:hypothetical protein